MSDRKNYKLGIKVGALFGVLWGALVEPFQALGFVGLYDAIHGTKFSNGWLNVVSSISIIIWIIYVLAGVIAGVVYAVVFVKVEDRIPTKRIVTKSVVFFSIAWLLTGLPRLIVNVREIAGAPWMFEPYTEGIVMAFALTLFWGALFGYLLERVRLNRPQDTTQ